MGWAGMRQDESKKSKPIPALPPIPVKQGRTKLPSPVKGRIFIYLYIF